MTARRRLQPERFGIARTVAQRGHDRIERPDSHRATLREPAVKDRDQPVGVFAVRRRPGGMVDGPTSRGAGESRSGAGATPLKSRRPPADHWPRRSCTAAPRTATGNVRPSAGDRLDHFVIAAAPIRVPAMAVVGDPVPIHRDADLDALLGEKLTELFVKQDAVGVDPQVKAAGPGQRRAELKGDPPEPGRPASNGSPPCSTTCTAGSP